MGRGVWVPAPDAQLRIWAGTTWIEFLAPRNDEEAGMSKPLLHAQRHEAQFAVAVADHLQDRLLPPSLHLIFTLFNVGRLAPPLLPQIAHNTSCGAPLVRGVRAAVT